VLARLIKLRQRFGIAAPRVAVRSEAPWYWRSLGLALALGVAAVLAASFYDAGRGLVSHDENGLRKELEESRHALREANAELERLRAASGSTDSRVLIERAAQQNLAKQVRALEQENARLREDLAAFENMLSPQARKLQSLTVQRFNVEPDGLPGEYRYRVLLVTPVGRSKDREFRGRLELVVSLSEGGRSAMMTFPEPQDAGAGAFRLAFKHFQRVEGTFKVSPKAKVESVQVRVYEAGSKEPRATQSLSPG
jgi:uncharacterized membrane protein